MTAANYIGYFARLVELGKMTKEEMREKLEEMHKIDMQQDEIDRKIVELMREQYKINDKEV